MHTKVETAINLQIKKEEFSARLYLAMAIWCEVNGYPGAASFLFQHADEERIHMMKMVHYVNNRGGKAELYAFEEPESEFTSLLDVFTQVLNHEEYITASINCFTSDSESLVPSFGRPAFNSSKVIVPRLSVSIDLNISFKPMISSSERFSAIT